MSLTHRFPISLRELEVLDVEDISPRLRRVTLGGPQMGAFERQGHPQPPLQSLGPDDHVKLFFPDPDTGILSLPDQLSDHLHWPQDPPAVSREYTPRSHDPAGGTLALEFVLHGHGIAGTWAAQAQVGQHLFVAGPKKSALISPADWYLLAGDETALPAIANWLEMLPQDAAVRALILVEDEAAIIPLAAPRDADIRWHVTDHADAGLLTQLLSATPLPAGDGFIWAGAEREAIATLRNHLSELQFPKDRFHVTSYWHKDDAAGD
ncbi:siderophore-interacting protein [Paracoccus suum]|uniref:Siderophore-interacting protein n=1 Tax=Paracoccus suum TaxID=2259340 RepID=A0A344PJI4_9RHOB|nr:siderophore-interacting protein [Paracoccus suum]AXC49539.1 siderophore-interacting protein [Paracoccus suum]